ncbi:MAG: hypothetical protein JXR50_02845 [Prolixibacteraceae bacterium]|nr:hypothetical protein [Prolixibacteraceae bacterium]
MGKTNELFAYLKKHPALFILVVIATAIWCLILYNVFVDEVHELGREIGAAFAK